MDTAGNLGMRPEEASRDLTRGGRVVVVVSGHVGRNLFCTPALRLIRRGWPAASIRVLAASRRGADVLEGNPDVDEVRVARWPSQIRWYARHADRVIGLCRSSLARSVEGLASRVVWLAPHRSARHRSDEMLEFVSETFKIPIEPDDRRYVMVPGDRDFARAALVLQGTSTHRWIGMHLGSGHTYVHGWRFWDRSREADARRWDVSKFVELGQSILLRDRRARLVLTGAASERFLARRFLRQLPETIDLVGRTSVLQLAAVMTRLSAFVTHDTGPLHIAAAMDTPLVAIFGPTDPTRTGPYPTRAHYRVIQGRSTSAVDPVAVAEAVRGVAVCDPRARAATLRH